MLLILLFAFPIVFGLAEGAPWSLASWLWPAPVSSNIPTVANHHQVLPQNNTANATNITGILQQNSTFSVFTTLLNQTGYLEKLGGGGGGGNESTQVAMGGQTPQYTVFAPDDAAFASLPSWITESVQNGSFSPAILKSLIAYHIHNATAPLPLPQNTTNTTNVKVRNYVMFGARLLQQQNASDVGTWGTVPNATSPGAFSGNYTSVKTLFQWANLTYYVNSTTGQPFVNDAAITSQANATNGRIYGINRIISPLWYFNTSLYSITSPPPPPPVSGPIPGSSRGGSGNSSSVASVTADFGIDAFDAFAAAFGVFGAT